MYTTAPFCIVALGYMSNEKKTASYTASMTGRLAHTMVVISVSVLYCGGNYKLEVGQHLSSIISKQLSDSVHHMLGSAHIRIGVRIPLVV
jgi:hypothetical protein